MRYLLGRGSEKAGPRLSDNLLPFMFSGMLFVQEKKTKQNNHQMRRCRRCQSYKERYKVDRCHIKKKEYRRCFRQKRMLSQCLLPSTKHLPMPYSSFLNASAWRTLVTVYLAAYLIFPIGALHMKNGPQTLTIHLFQSRQPALGDR